METIDEPASNELVALARRRVARKMGFFIHALVYVLVNAGLIAIDVVSGSGRHWAQFPLLGWGLGLGIHGIVTFAGGYGDALRQALLAREVEALRRASATHQPR